MEGSSAAVRGGRGRKRVGSTTRRVWSFAEECELMHSLKDLVLKGHKCDNGFWSGYLTLLENVMGAKFPGTDLKGEPHINSKIHVWKRQYVCLKSMLGISGVGLNSTTFHVEALPEVWDAQIKVDPLTKSLKNKAFSFYSQWGEIFGNDCANGQDSQLYVDVVNELNNSGRNNSRYQVDLDENTETHAATGNYTNDNASFSIDENSAAPTETMGHIAKRMGSGYDNRQRREQVYNSLCEIAFISVEARVAIAQYLCNNTKDMDMFFDLSDEAKTIFVTNIMRKLATI
ncbi:hypothetical protein ACS0TY_035836 [Phlomoides rotata]